MEQLSEKDCFVLSVRPLKGQTICSPNVRLGKGKHGPVDEDQTETKAQVNDVPGFIIQLFSPKPSQTANNALAATTGLPQKDKWSTSAEH